MKNILRHWPMVIATVAIPAMACLGGCNQFAAGLALFCDNPKVSVDAEFSKLEGKRVAIIVYADEMAVREHPTISEDLAKEIKFKIDNVASSKDKPKGLAKTTVLPTEKVATYLEKNPEWIGMKRSQLAKDLDVDYVVFVSLAEFIITGKDDMDASGGYVRSEVKVYSRTSSDPVWKEMDLTVKYPEKDKEQGSQRTGDRQQLYEQTQAVYACNLVNKFYDHEENR